jgi:hypothetical protein
MMNDQVQDAILLKSETTERQLQVDDCHNPSEIFGYVRVHFSKIFKCARKVIYNIHSHSGEQSIILICLVGSEAMKLYERLKREKSSGRADYLRCVCFPGG